MALAETVVDSDWERTFYGPATSDHERPAAWNSSYQQLSDLAARCLALMLLVLAAPLLAALWLAVKLSSNGPGFYRQKRMGHNGRVFMMYKLRSMRVDAEARTGPVWASAGTDSRVTPLGYWLRHLHLDELPQLYNIVRGEMALVGPRPERPEFVGLLAEQIPGYWERLRVKPGITGLAQINLPPDTDLHSVRCKLVLDREYIRSAEPLLDARIALCTLLRLMGLRGGRAVTLLGLSRSVVLDGAPLASAAQPPVAGEIPDFARHAAGRELAPPMSPAPLEAVRG